MKRIQRYFLKRSKRNQFRRMVAACQGFDVNYRDGDYYIGFTYTGGEVDLFSKEDQKIVKINGSRFNDVTLYITSEQAERCTHIIAEPFKHRQIERTP